MRRFTLLSGILLGFVLSACIEPIDISIAETARLLVVEGMITDQAGPYQVRLSWSTALDSDTFPAVNKALVQIEERESSLKSSLTEVNDGQYQTNPGSMQGLVGNHYRLLIQTAQGEAYESEWMLLRSSPPIDSIYHSFEQKLTPSGMFNGLQFFLNSGASNPENPAQYYRWQWVETWKYRVPLPTNFNYLGNNLIESKPSKDICYISEASTTINIGTSVDNAEDRLTGHPLLYVDTKDNRLRIRYSLLLRQMVMDEKEFLFWKVIKESTESVGSLFDRQPQSKTGNLRNVNDKGEKVLGYFSASGVSEKRIFVTGVEALPNGTRINQGFVSDCYAKMDTIFVDGITPQHELDEEVFDKIQAGQVFYDLLRSLFGPIEGYLLTTPQCSDCTVWGGFQDKPDFWID